jgi:hypothetical protein
MAQQPADYQTYAQKNIKNETMCTKWKRTRRAATSLLAVSRVEWERKGTQPPQHWPNSQLMIKPSYEKTNGDPHGCGIELQIIVYILGAYRHPTTRHRLNN